MKKLASTLALATLLTSQAVADVPLLLAQDNCAAIGQSVADQRGATLVGARSNGDGTCEVVLLIPAKDGKRPVREVVTVRQ